MKRHILEETVLYNRELSEQIDVVHTLCTAEDGFDD